MSDFSAACLVQSKYREAAEKHLDKGSYLIRLNEEWLCLLSERDLAGDIHTFSFTELQIELSQLIPVMLFRDAEDHGADFNILYGGKIVSSFSLEYGFEENRKYMIMEDLFGFDDYMHATEEEREEMLRKADLVYSEKRGEYEMELEAEFHAIYPENFKLFGFNKEKLDRISALLTIENYQTLKKREDCIIEHIMIRKFKEILGIGELEWTAWGYVDRNRELYEVLKVGEGI